MPSNGFVLQGQVPGAAGQVRDPVPSYKLAVQPDSADEACELPADQAADHEGRRLQPGLPDDGPAVADRALGRD